MGGSLLWREYETRDLFATTIRGTPPRGSRLSCGRLTRPRKAGGRQSVPREAHNTPIPLKRSPPASVKRLLGGAPEPCVTPQSCRSRADRGRRDRDTPSLCSRIPSCLRCSGHPLASCARTRPWSPPPSGYERPVPVGTDVGHDTPLRRAHLGADL